MTGFHSITGERVLWTWEPGICNGQKGRERGGDEAKADVRGETTGHKLTVFSFVSPFSSVNFHWLEGFLFDFWILFMTVSLRLRRVRKAKEINKLNITGSACPSIYLICLTQVIGLLFYYLKGTTSCGKHSVFNN